MAISRLVRVAAGDLAGQVDARGDFTEGWRQIERGSHALQGFTLEGAPGILHLSIGTLAEAICEDAGVSVYREPLPDRAQGGGKPSRVVLVPVAQHDGVDRSEVHAEPRRVLEQSVSGTRIEEDASVWPLQEQRETVLTDQPVCLARDGVFHEDRQCCRHSSLRLREVIESPIAARRLRDGFVRLLLAIERRQDIAGIAGLTA